MGRIQGLSTFAANFEVEKRASLDARMNVDTKADLLLTTTWEAHDGNEYTYIGMAVVVSGDGANNGIYILEGTDYTNINNWKYIGSTGGNTETLTADKTVYVSNTGSDTIGDGTELNPYATVKKVFDHTILASGYTFYVVFKSDYTFTQDDSNSINNLYGMVLRFEGEYTIEEDDIVWTLNDKFNFTSNIDLGAGIYNDAFVGKEIAPGRISCKPIKEANNFNVLYSSVKVESSFNKIISMNHTITFTQKTIGKYGLSIYFDNMKIIFTDNLYSLSSRLGYKNSDIDFNGFRPFYIKQGRGSYASCRVHGLSTYFLIGVGSVVLNSNYIIGDGTTRVIYGCAGGFHTNIIENVAYGFWSSRTNKCEILANYGNWFIDTQYIIVSAHDTNIKFFNYDYEGYNIKVTNCDYFLSLLSYQDGDGVVDTHIALNQGFSGTFNNGYITQGTYKNFKYLDLERNVNINIPGTYPEENGHTEYTMPNDTTNGKIVVGSVAENRKIKIEYVVSRLVGATTEYREGTISLLNNGTSVSMIENSQETGSTGVTFNNPTINGDNIEIDYTTTDNTTDATMETRIIRQMIFS